MSSCFIKKFLPFALAFLCGVAAWQLLGFKPRVVNGVFLGEHGRSWPTEHGGAWASARPAGEESRTWLFIRPSLSVAPLKREARACDGSSVRMRVLFGADGVAVPGNGFSLSPASYPLIGEAVAVAKSVEFTPATRDGKPVPIWANVTYSCRAESSSRYASGACVCGVAVDKDSARTWDGRPWRVVATNE